MKNGDRITGLGGDHDQTILALCTGACCAGAFVGLQFWEQGAAQPAPRDLAPGEPATFSAVVERRSGAGRGAPIGAVQFFVDGRPASDSIPLDRNGRSSWRTSRLRFGVSKLTARFIPRAKDLLSSSSLEIQHVVYERRRR